MKDNIWVLVYIILGSIAVLMLLFTLFVVNQHEQRVEMPCETLIQQNTNSNYVPLPKRCEKGE